MRYRPPRPRSGSAGASMRHPLATRRDLDQRSLARLALQADRPVVRGDPQRVAGVLLERPHLERQRGLHGRVVLPPAVQLFARRPGDSEGKRRRRPYEGSGRGRRPRYRPCSSSTRKHKSRAKYMPAKMVKTATRYAAWPCLPEASLGGDLHTPRTVELERRLPRRRGGLGPGRLSAHDGDAHRDVRCRVRASSGPTDRQTPFRRFRKPSAVSLSFAKWHPL